MFATLMKKTGILALALLTGLAALPGAAAAGRGDGLSLSLSPGTGTTVQVQRMASAQATPKADAPPADSYRVDTGDGISVTVFGEPDLSIRDERVKGDGTISYPLLGAIQVRGLNAAELESLITRRLADGYLKKPNVNVSIDTYRMFFIKGEVKNPGGYSYQDGLTVEKAVALAGGFTERASQSAITLVRDGDNPTEDKVKINARIKPGDIITIGESFF